MRSKSFVQSFLAPGTLVCLAALLAAPAMAGDIVLNIVDPPGVGFNDPTLVDPVGNNNGATLGEQRQIVFETAAAIWEAALAPNVDITLQSSFAPLSCTPASGTLGAAGPITIFANFAGAEWPNAWYATALANHLAGFDLTPGPPDPGLLQPPFNDEIVAFFNGDIGVNPNCLTGLTWYNGLDNLAPGNALDLLTVVLHEMGHGLGFLSVADESSGANFFGLSDVYGAFSRDNTTGLYWNQMDKQKRAASAVNTGNLVWRGPNVAAAAPGVLGGVPVVRVTAPASIAGDLAAQSASFGAALLPPPGVSGDVAVYNDGVGPNPNDGCDCPIVPPCNASAPFDVSVAGKIALIDRGSCTFALKAALAQISGAVGTIIANNQPTGLPPMGGSDLVTPLTPAVGISRDDGNLIKANLPGVNVTLTADPAVGFAGADAGGFVKLYNPNPVEPGSSISHWDTTATPNLLMEPSLSSDLQSATTLDLTPAMMSDIGWSGGPHCPVGSDDRAFVEIGDCNSGVANALGPFAFSVGKAAGGPGQALGVEVNGGCTIQDMVNACGLQGNSGQLESCVQHTTNYLQSIGALTAAEGQAIEACAN